MQTGKKNTIKCPKCKEHIQINDVEMDEYGQLLVICDCGKKIAIKRKNKK